MKLSDFKYNVPEKLIAQYPPKKRGLSKLMVINRETQQIEDRNFPDIVDYFKPGDCLVVNETKVFPARLTGIKERPTPKSKFFCFASSRRTCGRCLSSRRAR
jgi:S-adenosylmethionine:tRNA ribosyltransferase-isomerase